MESAARRSGGGVWEGLYRVVMRRTPIYVTFVVAGAFLGERAVDYGIRTLWEHNNVGQPTLIFTLAWVGQFFNFLITHVRKRYEDIPVLGQRPSE